MKFTTAISPLLLAGGAAATIQNLTLSTFWPFVQDHDLSMVSYVSPWCKFCTDIAPKFDEAAASLESEGIPLIRVDCTMEEDICDDVPIFPTLRIFRKGEATVYHGIRTAEAIVNTMRRNTLPLVTDLSSPSDLDTFRKQDRVSVVGYFDDATQSEAKANFTSLAEKVRNKYSFATTSDPKFGKLNNVQAPAIAAFKNFDIDSSVETFNKLFTLEHMEQWLENNTAPFISEYGLDIGLSSLKLRETYTAYLYASTREERERLKQEIAPVASKFKGRILFVTIDPEDKSPVAKNPKDFGFTPGVWPALGVTDPETKEYTFAFPKQGSYEALSSSDAETFLQSVLDGSAEKITKEAKGQQEGLQSFWGEQAKLGKRGGK